MSYKSRPLSGLGKGGRSRPPPPVGTRPSPPAYIGVDFASPAPDKSYTYAIVPDSTSYLLVREYKVPAAQGKDFVGSVYVHLNSFYEKLYHRPERALMSDDIWRQFVGEVLRRDYSGGMPSRGTFKFEGIPFYAVSGFYCDLRLEKMAT